MSDGHREPGDTTLYRMDPTELNEDEIGYYIKALATDPHCGGAMVLSQALGCGDAQLFCYNDGEAILIIITRFINSPDGYKELLLHMMAGSGLDEERVLTLARRRELYSQLMDYAVRNRCHRITAYMQPGLWEKMQLEPEIKWKEEYVQIALYPEDVYDGV